MGHESRNNAEIAFWKNVSEKVVNFHRAVCHAFIFISDAAFAPNIPSCVYYISLTEYNMTSTPNFMPSLHNNYNRKKKVSYPPHRMYM